jgi:hypothetical protein
MGRVLARPNPVGYVPLSQTVARSLKSLGCTKFRKMEPSSNPNPASLMPRRTAHPFTAYAALCALALGGCASSAPAAESPRATPQETPTRAQAQGPRPYSQVIPGSAQTDEGLFKVHRVEGNLLYEIPDSLLGRDMLLITQIAGSPEDLSPFLNAGTNVAEQVVRWERMENRVLLRTVSFAKVAPDSLPIARSVQVNTFPPVIRSFEVRAESPDGGPVIDVTSLFETDVEAIGGLNAMQRNNFGVRRLDPSRTFIDSARSFPLNIEVRHTLTYEAARPPTQARTGTISMQMAQSMVLLPEEPMRHRYHDPRVGWFTVQQVDFGSEEYKADTRRLIRRWRLEPSDPQAYARGELVEPRKPIVFYLDPGTPEEWRPYIRQGVLDWAPVFETAGFRNAIQVKDPPSPEEDPEFSPEDVRYNMVRYTANLTRNAVGPSVSDPRTGEIIASDIIWYHNHLRSYRNRLMIETGAANPAARSLRMDRDYIGEAVRQVIAHEIGHAIGLPHNMTASAAFPVDSLRSPSFTSRHGVSASVMEYARQNYVAQPGDGVERFIRMMGPYDHYAVNWGYRVIPDADTPEKEKPVLDRWILERAHDPMYRFGPQGYNLDPRIQTEDLGDDPVRASGYGIANLQRVLPNLVEWTSTPGDDYTELEELYGELVASWNRYIGHVVTVIGGVHQTLLTSDQEGVPFEPVAGDRQREALAFLARELFATPEWLNEPSVLRRTEPAGALDRIQRLQALRLRQLLDPARMARMVEAEVFDPTRAYPLPEFMGDLQRAIWTELDGSGSIDPFRRNLQRAHVERLGAFVTGELGDGISSDAAALARAELVRLRDAIDARLRRSGGDTLTRAHLQDQGARIRGILEG